MTVCRNCKGEGYLGNDGIFNLTRRTCYACNGSGWVEEKTVKKPDLSNDSEWQRRNNRLPEICMDLLNFIVRKGLCTDPSFVELAKYWSGLEKEAPPDTKMVIKAMRGYMHNCENRS